MYRKKQYGCLQHFFTEFLPRGKTLEWAKKVKRKRFVTARWSGQAELVKVDGCGQMAFSIPPHGEPHATDCAVLTKWQTCRIQMERWKKCLPGLLILLTLPCGCKWNPCYLMNRNHVTSEATESVVAEAAGWVYHWVNGLWPSLPTPSARQEVADWDISIVTPTLLLCFLQQSREVICSDRVLGHRKWASVDNHNNTHHSKLEIHCTWKLLTTGGTPGCVAHSGRGSVDNPVRVFVVCDGHKPKAKKCPQICALVHPTSLYPNPFTGPKIRLSLNQHSYVSIAQQLLLKGRPHRVLTRVKIDARQKYLLRCSEK